MVLVDMAILYGHPIASISRGASFRCVLDDSPG